MEFVYLIMMIILFTVFNININGIKDEQKRIELKLDRIIEHLGISDPTKEQIGEGLEYELRSLVEEGKKVKAVKKLREATGMDLIEAKEYIDKL